MVVCTATGNSPRRWNRIEKSCGARSQITFASWSMQAEVQSRRSRELHLAERARGQVVGDASNPRTEQEGVPHHELDAGVTRSLGKEARLGHRSGKGLLDQHMTPRVDRLRCKRGVGFHRGCDDHRSNGIVVERMLEREGPRDRRIRLAHGLEATDMVVDGDDLIRARELHEVPEQFRAPVTESDQCNLHAACPSALESALTQRSIC